MKNAFLAVVLPILFSGCTRSSELNRLVEKDIERGELTYDSIESPLQAAVYRNNLPYLKKLLREGHDVKFVTEEDNENLLFLAAYYAGYGLNKFLLKKGLDPNDQSKHGDTPFEVALGGNSPEVIKLYLKNGYDIKNLDISSVSSIYKRCSGDGVEILQILIDEGFNLNDTSYNVFDTPLAYDLPVLVDFLIEHGADYKRKNAEGWTYLHWAAYYDATECCKLLKKYKELNIPTTGELVWQRYISKEFSEYVYQPALLPIDIARINGNSEIVAILEN